MGTGSWTESYRADERRIGQILYIRPHVAGLLRQRAGNHGIQDQKRLSERRLE